ncbi:LPS-assembly protein LptD [Jannaschia sp. LMIT008]|uniref:LPS-assembly protein LptD n=1 Tax=Jannaschia maritima TaxID=3032585 RepID=UPI002811D4AE|nr:LPS assembly protein LptD [Jannaschia sp. LMIT008]
MGKGFAYLLVAMLIATAPAARAQTGPATLVADDIAFDQGSLTASGAVEIFADGRVLRARRLTYLREEDRLLVEGPLTLVDGDRSILVADFASLSRDLRGSVLRGARLVLDRRLQIAANEVVRDEAGRYTQLYETVASSCEVCADRPTPLWQIRARRIVRDEVERQLYFEGARFEVAGVPVAWFPTLRLPGPGLARSTGFLAPRFRSDDILGTGVTVPYFVALGPSRDLTVAPFATNRGATALNLRYRQAFDAGAFAIEGAFGRDDTRRGSTRGYVFADGSFVLPLNYRLDFDLEAVTDDTYLLDYAITEKDRLDSRIALSRVERDNRILAEVIAFRTLRDGERSDTLPSRVVTLTREQRRDLWGGIRSWQIEAHGRERPVSVAPPGFPPSSARDVARLSASAGWRRHWVLGPGLVTTAFAEGHLDVYQVAQDPTFADRMVTRFVPYAGLEARLPLVRHDGTVRHVLQSIAQIVLAPDRRPAVPNEDSITPEFDEGNLTATSRFPGRDVRELGRRVNLGLSYAREPLEGWSVDAFVGRTFRTRDLTQFPTGTGLDSKASDWLVSLAAGTGERISVLSRTLFDDRLDVSRSETILRWRDADARLETRYTFLEADAAAGRPIDTSEWGLDAGVDLTADWTGRVNWRYDFVTNDASRAGIGLTYRSDCVTVDFDVERRFTSGSVLQSTTLFGLSVELAGFGADDARKRRNRCGT